MSKDTFNSVRRAAARFFDLVYVRSLYRLKPVVPVSSFKSPTRFSLVTVNYSTTYYLKLMLLTLCEQQELSALRRIVIVDNNSRDGGVAFLEQLAAENDHVHLLKNKSNNTHAGGLREGIDYIAKLDKDLDAKNASNALLVCDTDIVFLKPETLKEIGSVLAEGDTVFAGELRYGLYPYPEAQASFFAMRRDCYARPDIHPIVHHGAPAYFMQRSMWRAGLKLVNFPSNEGGYILHRGRGGVSAAQKYHRSSAHATAKESEPHFMDIEGGEALWNTVEERYRNFLKRMNERALLDHFRQRFSKLASA